MTERGNGWTSALVPLVAAGATLLAPGTGAGEDFAGSAGALSAGGLGLLTWRGANGLGGAAAIALLRAAVAAGAVVLARGKSRRERGLDLAGAVVAASCFGLLLPWGPGCLLPLFFTATVAAGRRSAAGAALVSFAWPLADPLFWLGAPLAALVLARRENRAGIAPLAAFLNPVGLVGLARGAAFAPVLASWIGLPAFAAPSPLGPVFWIAVLAATALVLEGWEQPERRAGDLTLLAASLMLGPVASLAPLGFLAGGSGVREPAPEVNIAAASRRTPESNERQAAGFEEETRPKAPHGGPAPWCHSGDQREPGILLEALDERSRTPPLRGVAGMTVKNSRTGAQSRERGLECGSLLPQKLLLPRSLAAPLLCLAAVAPALWLILAPAGESLPPAAASALGELPAGGWTLVTEPVWSAAASRRARGGGVQPSLDFLNLESFRRTYPEGLEAPWAWGPLPRADFLLLRARYPEARCGRDWAPGWRLVDAGAQWALFGALAGEAGRWVEGHALTAYDPFRPLPQDLAAKEKALGEALRVAKREPAFFEALRDAGRLETDLGRAADARDHLDAALKLRPEDAQVWNDLGVALQLGGRPDEAAAAFERSIRLKPSEILPRMNLAGLEMARGNRDKAELLLRGVVKADPAFYPAVRMLAGILAGEGRRKEAAAVIEGIAPDSRTQQDEALLREGRR